MQGVPLDQIQEPPHSLAASAQGPQRTPQAQEVAARPVLVVLVKMVARLLLFPHGAVLVVAAQMVARLQRGAPQLITLVARVALAQVEPLAAAAVASIITTLDLQPPVREQAVVEPAALMLSAITLSLEAQAALTTYGRKHPIARQQARAVAVAAALLSLLVLLVRAQFMAVLVDRMAVAAAAVAASVPVELEQQHLKVLPVPTASSFSNTLQSLLMITISARPH